MPKERNKLKIVWDKVKKTAVQSTVIPDVSFNSIINNLVSVGPFYFYVIDFFDRKLSNVSPSI